MQNYRTLTKVTNLPKVVIPTYDERKFMHHYDNGNSMLVTYYPKHNGKNSFITLQVWDSKQEKHFHKNITSYIYPEIANLPKDNDDFINDDFVLKCIASCEQNICSLDFANLNKDIVNYGCANGWGENREVPLIDKYYEDRKTMPWLCAYEWECSLGRCWTEYVNYTYGYKYNCDSSD